MDWISIEERLPDRNTRYAAKYGVSVLYYDKKEEIDSGYFTPYIASFSFEHQEFLGQIDGLNDPTYGDWFPVELTHWTELPEAPN